MCLKIMQKYISNPTKNNFWYSIYKYIKYSCSQTEGDVLNNINQRPVLHVSQCVSCRLIYCRALCEAGLTQTRSLSWMCWYLQIR